MHLLYSLHGLWLTLLPDEESLYQRSTAESTEKLLGGGGAFSVDLSFFKVEKKRSTLAVEKGKLKGSSCLTSKVFGHLTVSSEEYNWYQTLL